MKRISLMILAVSILIGCSAIASYAGVKTIRPDQLQVFKSDAVYEQCADYLRSTTTSEASFTAQIKLPVGKSITKFTHFHSGSGTPYTSVYLYRTKMGEPWDTVVQSSSYDSSSLVIPVEGNIYIPKIKSGYTYWLYVVSNNLNSFFKGIKIKYK